MLLLAATLGMSPRADAEVAARLDEKPTDAAEGNRKTARAPAPQGEDGDPFTEVAARLQAEDYAGALRLVRPEMASPAFAQRPLAERQRLHQAAGWVAARAGELDYAREQFAMAIAAGTHAADVWYWLTLVEMERGDYEAAAKAMAAMARRWPDDMDKFELPQVWATFGRTRQGGDAERELLEALFESGWDQPQLGGADEMWHRLALRRLADGDREGAAEVTARYEARGIALVTSPRCGAWTADRGGWRCRRGVDRSL